MAGGELAPDRQGLLASGWCERMALQTGSGACVGLCVPQVLSHGPWARSGSTHPNTHDVPPCMKVTVTWDLLFYLTNIYLVPVMCHHCSGRWETATNQTLCGHLA